MEDIDGRWYLFEFSDICWTGWQQKDGNYYFLDMNGYADRLASGQPEMVLSGK